MTKYYITIEQPLCKTWELDADTIEQAHEMASEKYKAGEFVLTSDDIGTSAQIKIQDENNDDAIEWTDLL